MYIKVHIASCFKNGVNEGMIFPDLEQNCKFSAISSDQQRSKNLLIAQYEPVGM